MFFKPGALKNFGNFSGKIPVLESLYQKVGLSGCNFIKKIPTQAFSCEICYFLR